MLLACQQIIASFHAFATLCQLEKCWILSVAVLGATAQHVAHWSSHPCVEVAVSKRRMQALHPQPMPSAMRTGCVRHSVHRPCLCSRIRSEQPHRHQQGLTALHTARQLQVKPGPNSNAKVGSAVANCMPIVYDPAHALQHPALAPSAQPSQRDSSDAGSGSTGSTAEATASRDGEELSCFGTGMDVTCTASFDDGPAVKAANGSADTAAAGGLESSDATQPAEEAPPVLSGVAKVLSMAVLVSPFALWGTSMVGMKVRSLPLRPRLA